MKKLIVLCFLMIPMLGVAADNSAYDKPIVISSLLKKPLVAVLRGMNDHGWIVKDQKPGQVVALLDYRQRQITVDINYTKSEISFAPVSSRKLNCSGTAEQCPIEDAYYQAWRSNLRSSIKNAADDMTKKAMKALEKE
ncbi:Uncharacterised protein [BD1-7 clade bacterium]|uniref:Uncharacterized protein n=1 Tax=BD1-7 clade bacterium TaxID=2029982 RepID=A0A5S9NND1_9GAMM|nr:Uncharacterised protein [BD1-7 clade bacterium]